MKYELVFEGGGAKGMVFVGAYTELFRRGHGYNRLLGTSAGAITATLLAAGYWVEEMLETLAETKNRRPVFASFMGTPPALTDEEIRMGAIRRLLDGVNLKFVPDCIERRFGQKLGSMPEDDRHHPYGQNAHAASR